MANLLSKDLILGLDDSQYEDVYIPEWNGHVRVRGLNGTERDAFEASVVIGKGGNKDVNILNIRAKLVVKACIDENGQRLFSDQDVQALGQKSAVALNRLFAVAQRLSGLTEADVQELGKASANGQSGDSTSD